MTKFEVLDDQLEKLIHPRYYRWRQTDPSKIYLDGEFSTTELRAIAAIVSEYNVT